MIDRVRFEAGDTFEQFMAKEFTNKLFWQQIYKRAVVGDDVLRRARELGANGTSSLSMKIGAATR